METYLDKLNKEQKEAVLTTAHKTLVIAGAGSGKTRVLTTRINYLLNKGIEKSDICAFTFTNKAAREMKIRLKQLRNNDDLPIISTFHSFCYSFLIHPDFYYKLGFVTKLNIITDQDKSKIIKSILENYNKDYSNIPFVKAISQIKNKAKIKDIAETDLPLINEIYNIYQQKLLINNLIDFDDMIPLFLKLCQNEEFKEYVQYKYILVDECQDTNQIQYELIKTLSEKYKNIFMVGDEDQLIYSFRSSDINILNDYKNNADKMIILKENYRSNKEILEHANTLIANNKTRLQKELYTKNNDKAYIYIKEYASMVEEAKSVAKEIKMLLTIYEPKDIAILYRNNNQSFQLEKELKQNQINYTIFGSKPLFEYAEINKIIAAYHLLTDSNNTYFLEKILNIEAFIYKEFINEYHKQNKDLLTFGRTYNNLKIAKTSQNLIDLINNLKQYNNEELFNKILELTNLNKYLKTSNNQKNEYKRIIAFKEILMNINKEEINQTINDLLLENKQEKIENNISLLTIHKAKGLEFKVIFLIGFNEGILPGLDKKGLDLEEERRLCYVALTRAKERLYLSSSNSHFINGKLYKMKPSKFLIEANFIDKDTYNFFNNYFYNH